MTGSSRWRRGDRDKRSDPCDRQDRDVLLLPGRDGGLYQRAMLIHPMQGALHGLQQLLGEPSVMPVLGHARDQVTLLGDHLFRASDVAERLGKMVMLGCHRSHFHARASAGNTDKAFCVPRAQPTARAPLSGANRLPI
jgi:hypothetical protein